MSRQFMGAFVASDLKERNRSTVYSLVKGEREISKAEIARRSGISAPTVIKIIDYFSALGIVREASDESSGPTSPVLGRRPRLLSLEPSSAFSVGVEYDGVHLSVGIVDLAGGIKTLVRRPASPDARLFLGRELVPAVEEALKEASLPREEVKGLGIGLPGTVDRARSILRFAPLVGITEAFDCGPLVRGLEAELGFPVLLENDANAAALGEYAARSLSSSEDLLFVEIGRGLGAGLILDGKLRAGPQGFAGELGYLVFDKEWRASFEAPGWLENKMNLAGFWEEAGAKGGPSEASLCRVADMLSLALANICIALDVKRVVVGRAGQEAFGAALLARIQKSLSRLSVLEVSCEAPIAPEPGVRGTAELAAQRWLKTVFAG
jgi:predicted NBD/HSP70 family sugar kinase